MTFTDLGLLSIVVAVRTVLSLHLNHDLHQIKHALDHEREEVEKEREHAAKEMKAHSLVARYFPSEKRDGLLKTYTAHHATSHASYADAVLTVLAFSSELQKYSKQCGIARRHQNRADRSHKIPSSLRTKLANAPPSIVTFPLNAVDFILSAAVIQPKEAKSAQPNFNI
eukprot:CAMPEP_0167811634 /NCGR_PEP_ID=MMETSP0112_2-20121227/786_1 /TAXON_ID=91324 /ORGANISM="Lotharella globosa, Strain CCCM811" /LENGTH=168 /DNA_ID=CAMNT_0007710385 /DNA_START=561 /DNA_END=1067 /DNA_ORIENTATION=+